MSLEQKIELQQFNNCTCLRKYVKVIDNKIIMNKQVYLYKISNSDLLYYERLDENDTRHKTIVFVDDLEKFFELMEFMDYKQYTIW
jgi:hypothetical protein